jgi:hypothetical protein
MERVPVNLQATSRPSAGTLARAFASLLFAFSRNGGMAVMSDWQNRYLLGIYDHLGQTTRTATSQTERFETFDNLLYLMDITIQGTKYRTLLSGLCFSEGDDVNAVVDARGTLLAVARPDQTAMSIYSSCKYGFAHLMENLWWASKLFFWVMMIPMLLIDVGELTLNNAWDLTVFLIVLAGSPVILMAMSALLCGLANRDEFVPAFLASSIFATLSRPDLAAANFNVAESEAPHDGRKRPGDKGRILYFWPADRAVTVARVKALAANSPNSQVGHSEG